MVREDMKDFLNVHLELKGRYVGFYVIIRYSDRVLSAIVC